MNGTDPLEAEASFEDILSGLQNVVERLERGDLPLEESLRIFEEGMMLSKLGARRLDEAESRVEQLLVRGDVLETKTLESEEGP